VAASVSRFGADPNGLQAGRGGAVLVSSTPSSQRIPLHGDPSSSGPCATLRGRLGPSARGFRPDESATALSLILATEPAESSAEGHRLESWGQTVRPSKPHYSALTTATPREP
jgi:hypothetical protein